MFVYVKLHALNWLIHHEMVVTIFFNMYVNKLIHPDPEKMSLKADTTLG